jgi:hypothetical protein
MSEQLETDYLVVGAGAAGMAFTDALLTHSGATVTLVDRRHAPGGHWVDAYPYVRLHQPSTFYGVDSVPLGQDAIDTSGTNQGFYERASADELRAYFARVMERHFLPTGRVRYFPGCDYQGGHRFVSRMTGASRTVRVRRKVVDTTYVEGKIPATSAPPFDVAEGVRVVTPGELPRLDTAPERFVIVGAGKTALDTCVWLLEQGVAASAIQWVRPREGWWLNRRFQQPLALLPELYRCAAAQVEAMALLGSAAEIFERLEAEGILMRIDPRVTPTMFHGAIVSEPELSLLRRVEDVVRMGRVRRIEQDAIVLDGGRVPTDAGTVHIHCATQGLARPPLRPIFEADRVTVQPFTWGFACFQFATLGVVEAVVANDADKNALCAPIPYWDACDDYLTSFLAMLTGDRARAAHPQLARWSKASRLNPVGGVSAQQADPRVAEARERIKRHGAAAAANLQRLTAARG